MKTARWILCIVALSAVIIGCGEETLDFVGVHADADPHDLSAYYHWWDIAVINGKKMNIRRGSVYFSGTGEFTHVFKAYRTTVNLSDDSAIIVGYTYTNRGRYTTRRNKLTITESSTQRDVDVPLDPEAAWHPQREGTLEALTSQIVAEIESEPRLILRVFKSGTKYTWEVEGRLLTLSRPQQRIRLLRHTLLETLERGYFFVVAPMRLKLGTKEIAVASIFKVVASGSYTATIHFVFGNAIIVRCCSDGSVDEPTYRSTFHSDGTPTQLYRLVQRLKSKAWLRREREK